MKSLFLAFSACLLYTTSAQIASCDVFQEGLCNLDENNIVGAYTDVATAIECQELCLSFAECNFFSFIGIQCFLVKTCDTLDLAEGCISGPKEPSLESCQDTTFPPSTAPPTSAAPTTATPTTAAPTTATPTTAAPTTAAPTTAAPTTLPPTSAAPTTTTPTPTTTLPLCNVTMGALCDSHNNLILEVEHLNTPSDCQSICQNHPECNWWSHWAEEGGEHWGRCYLHYSCDVLDDHECRECGGVTRPGHRCNCQHGTPWPDLDSCDDGQVHTPCEDDFITGSLCDKHENEILHVTHIPTASDCQSICQNHPECNFFSHTTRHEGECWLHYNCDIHDPHECDEWENQCVSGPQYPDMDDCSSPEL